MILGIVAFIALLGVLVLAHEWGHFFVARRLGVRVEEFAFGFPPRVASITKNGVRYAWNLIPIGGYVKIYGESGEGQGNRESFSSRPIWQRFIIIAAGVFMNVVLAWALFSAGHAIGFPTVLNEDDTALAHVTVLDVVPNSPAAAGGIQFGDVIRRLEAPGEEVGVAAMRDVQDFVSRHRGQSITVMVVRGAEERTMAVVPRADPPPGEGALGISMARVGVVAAPWWRARGTAQRPPSMRSSRSRGGLGR